MVNCESTLGSMNQNVKSSRFECLPEQRELSALCCIEFRQGRLIQARIRLLGESERKADRVASLVASSVEKPKVLDWFEREKSQSRVGCEESKRQRQSDEFCDAFVF